MIKFYLIKNGQDKAVDITNIVKEGAKLQKSIKNFAWITEFSILRNKMFDDIATGDILLIQLDKKEIFSGIIIEEDVTKLSFKAIDYAWYFNNNEEIYQFEDVESSVVVTKLIETFGGNVGNIESTNLMVDKFYFGKTLGAIIKDIIKNIKELEKKDYRFFYRDTKFHFELSKKDKYRAKKYKPLERLKAVLNGYEFNALNYIEEPTRKLSLKDMRNSVRVYRTNGKQYIETSGARDSDSVKKYGLLQKLVSYKENDLSKGNLKADNLLAEHNKLNDKVSISLATLSQFIYDGELLKLKYDDYKIDGVYELTSVTYEFTNHNTIFKAQMELELVQ